MPIVTPVPGDPYATVGEVLQLARVIVNDAFGPNGLDGDLLSNTQPYTPILLQSAWEQLQDELADAGVESLVKETIITAVPAVTMIDPSVTTYITWDGYFDGTVLQPIDVGIPVLPFDMIQPAAKGCWERVTGSGSAFTEVIPWDGGLPEGYQSDKLRWYEWRDDKLFFKGATQVLDLKLRYLAYRPELAADGTISNDELVPIMRSKRAMAYLIGSEFARPRGAQVADNLYAMAEAEIAKLTRRTAHRKAAISYRRRAFGQ